MGERADQENRSKQSHGTTLALARPYRNTGHRLGGNSIEPETAARVDRVSPDPARAITGWLATG